MLGETETVEPLCTSCEQPYRDHHKNCDWCERFDPPRCPIGGVK